MSRPSTDEESPPPHAFCVERVPQSADIDELEHVSNVVYVRWVQDAAVEHSRSAGYDSAAYRELGAAFVVRRHEIDYVQPAFAGERVRICTWVESWRGASAVRRTSIRRSDGREVAQARTLWVFVDRRSGRPRKLPPDLVRRFEGG